MPVARALPMNALAERYVRLVLAVGEHDAGYVDAYYGPEPWREDAARASVSLADLAATAGELCAEAETASAAPCDDELEALRCEYLHRQLAAVSARIHLLRGAAMTFDEESKALYDAVAPSYPDAYFAEVLDELDGCLPGTGPLIERYDIFRSAFVIPADRLEAVFARAIAEGRARTLKHIALPDGEEFVVEYVTDKPWSGYNWYHGRYRSVIQVNTDLPTYVDRAVDLACHEGYPGHHVYNALLEQTLVRDRGWIEFTVYPLFSPQSLIAEGTANYGIDITFSRAERVAFEREALFPIAGLEPRQADDYYAVQGLVDRLAYAGNEAARRYLNGEIDRADAIEWLTRYAMMSPARADQRTRFFDVYRSYVINYNLGKDLVRDFIEAEAGADVGRRWAAFARLLSSPRLPSGLRPPPEPRGVA